MAGLSPTLLCALTLLAAIWSAHGQLDDFSLEDALDDIGSTKKPEPTPKVLPKPPPKKPDFPMTTRKPRVTTKPPKKPDPNDLDLSDALDDKNDRPFGGGGGGGGGGSTIRDKDKPSGGKGNDLSDSDLDDLVNGGYKPDKGKGGRGGGGGGGGGGRGSSGYGGDSENTDTGSLAETGTIAGIASALAMALIGAVSSYISYQQKKFCFSIQQGLNAEYVKGEHMEGVVTEEPQVKYSSLQSQSAVPPSEDPSKV